MGEGQSCGTATRREHTVGWGLAPHRNVAAIEQ